MKKPAKILLALLAAVLLVVGSVAATLAFLTDQDDVSNTFTVGQVNIALDEAPVDPITGATVAGNRVQANNYHLLPGHEYVKDPTVTVKADSEPSYIRMLVTVNDYAKLCAAIPAFVVNDGTDNVFLLQNLVTGWDDAKWVYTDFTLEGNKATYEFRYADIVSTRDAAAAKVLEPLFETIVIPSTLNNAEIVNLEGAQIDIVAQAIQADGFADDNDAWASFAGQPVVENP